MEITSRPQSDSAQLKHKMNNSTPMDRLSFEDSQHPSTILTRLSTLRKNQQFCDVTLAVGSREIHAHKAVLACSSVYFMELFSSEVNKYYKLETFEYDSFKALVNYAYTAKLDVAGEMVKSVYKMAMILKMEGASKACSDYLAQHLTAANCLGIRNFANSSHERGLLDQVDSYIVGHIDDVSSSREFCSLPYIQVDLLGVTSGEVNTGAERQLCKMVLEWAEQMLEEHETLDSLCQHASVLLLTADNRLRDCRDMDDFTLNNSDIIQDYKKASKKRQTPPQKSKDKVSRSPRSPQEPGGVFRVASIDSTNGKAREEAKIIVSKQISERRCIALAVLENTLVVLSLTLKPHVPSASPQSNGTSSTDLPSPVPGNSPRGSISERQVTLTPLATMGCARCGVGTAVLDGKLIALGGYDRGECLKTVEAFHLSENKWTPMTPLRSPRGRFDVSQLHGQLYACGGSDGSSELKSVECYDPESSTWQELPCMKRSRSSAGVAVLGGKLYVVGGWSGLSGIAECEVYDSDEARWNSIAAMNVGRSQAAVCATDGKLYAIGGCDSWNCMNTAEMYDPSTDKWLPLPAMACCRRGAGVAVFKGKLYLVGGSDGTSSLASVEIFDLETQSWSFGPSLITNRANVGVAVMHNRLFAVGGFSGKQFLDTIEYLAEEAGEWCHFLPVEPVI